MLLYHNKADMRCGENINNIKKKLVAGDLKKDGTYVFR